MIDRIQILRSIGRFASFEWPNETPDFRKVNLVFGYNGSGKTTISNVLRLFSQSEVARSSALFSEMVSGDDPMAVVRLDGKDQLYDPDAPRVPIYVFNADFVTEHVYEGGTLRCKGFDSTVVTKDQLTNPRIRALENEITDLQGKQASNEAVLEELNRAFETIKKSLSQELNDSVKGSRSPSMEIPSKAPSTTALEARKLLDARYESLRLAQNLRDVARDADLLAKMRFAPLPGETEQVAKLLAEPLPVASIEQVEEKLRAFASSLTQKLRPIDWYEAGYELLSGENSEHKPTCPLCGSDLTGRVEGILAEYRAFFSESREGLNRKADALLLRLRQGGSILGANHEAFALLRLLEERYARLCAWPPELPLATSKLEALLKEQHGLVEEKKTSIGQTHWNFESKGAQLAVDEYADALVRLEEHRQRLEQSLQESAVDPDEVIRSVKEAMVSSAHAQFESFAEGNQSEKYRNASIASQDARRKIAELQATRSREVARLKDESGLVNTYLHRLGLDHFHIIIPRTGEAGGIRIQFAAGAAKATLRNSLSESEKTGLGFAYFLSKVDYEVLRNPEANIGKTAIVVDDPVSSLDEDRLHRTVCLICELFLEDAEQLFVLSHNVTFMRFLSNQIGNPREEIGGKKVSARSDYYMSNWEENIRQLPDTLENYKTTYFQKLETLVRYRAGDIDYESVKRFLPNYTRTVLEAFLSIKLFVINQGSSGDRFRAAGLDRLTNFLKGKTHLFKDFSPVADVSAGTLVEKLERVRAISDPQSHGSPQDIDHVDFVSEPELRMLVSDALNVIEFLDRIHLSQVEGAQQASTSP